MSISKHKHVECQSARQANNNQVLSVSPHSGDGMLRLSFFSGELYCSNVISKDEARELAENILELLEEIPYPNQESLDPPQQEAA